MKKWINLHDIKIRFRCRCGASTMHSLDNISIGERILYYRIPFEFYTRKDYSLTIVFSAMAIECELFSVCCIKHSIDALQSGKVLSDDEIREEVEYLFRQKRDVKKVMNMVIKKWSGKNFNQYIHASKEILNVIKNGFPSINIQNPAQSIIDKVFKIRNRILHSGLSTSRRKDAVYAFSHSALMIQIINESRK